MVIPTYNRSQTLRVAIQSVFQQSYGDFEVLVADDASTDDTRDIVAGMADTRIRYHRHAQNLGVNFNWRFALTTPQTEFVAPLADDDLFLPDHLAVGLAAIEQFPDAAYYTCPAEFFGDSKATGHYRPTALGDQAEPLVYVEPRRAAAFLGTDNPGPINCMICRRQALHPRIYWGTQDYLPQDLLLMTQLMVQGGFVFGSRPMTRFRVHADNTSLSTVRKKRWRFNCMVWYGIRWLCNYLLAEKINSLDDIERHGLESPNWERHVVPLVLGLASWDSPPHLRALAQRIFAARTDVDAHSARFRLARRLGIYTIPLLESFTQVYVGWQPPRDFSVTATQPVQ